MSIIQLPFSLSDPDPRLLTVTDHEAEIAAIPSLVAWNAFRASFVTVDESNALASVAARAGAGEISISNAALKPAFNASGGPYKKGKANFSGDGMTWSVAPPTAAYTKVAVFRVDEDTTLDLQSIMGNNVSSVKHRIYVEPLESTPLIHHQIHNTSLNPENIINVEAEGLVPGQWHVVLATFNGATGTAKIILDNGTPVADTVETFTAAPDASYFMGCDGISSGIPGNPFDGDIADTMLFSADLTLEENAAYLATLREYMLAAYGLSI